ncbi:hypothetical protein [Dokdonella sp.]|uniref:hypothetical protein n=1 Tax=Dokdonella sp. TaxID=2291710 RepID=UPI00352890C7
MAIEDARSDVIEISRRTGKHVEIAELDLVTTSAERGEGGGWIVTLTYGDCTFTVHQKKGMLGSTIAREGCARIYP